MLEDGVLPSVDTGHGPYLFNKDDINRSAMSTFRFKDMQIWWICLFLGSIANHHSQKCLGPTLTNVSSTMNSSIPFLFDYIFLRMIFFECFSFFCFFLCCFCDHKFFLIYRMYIFYREIVFPLISIQRYKSSTRSTDKVIKKTLSKIFAIMVKRVVALYVKF